MMSGNYTTIDNQNVSGSVPAVSDPPGHVAVKFNDTSLQTFPPERKGSSLALLDRLVMPMPISGSSESQSSGGWFKIFTVAAYQPYFDVDTSDVLERIKDSLFPFGGSFNEKTASNPDLYGPFWICPTLIFVAASIGTFATYLAHKLQHKEWNYDINLVTWSAGLFYGYVLVVPLCLYLFSCSVYTDTPCLSSFLQCVYLLFRWSFSDG
ncbi:hypothetical protein L1987_17959 [Smallanthus sonchifolius]|uniref:Uncharacterized protein n=1 Tax=Smallanthus sonchifolius TaxID=185202 RepID=A0ACB9IZ01_9ASTR|nr:hypothetical protein L1987_17959 [Smallanthus sonchifolius]